MTAVRALVPRWIAFLGCASLCATGALACGAFSADASDDVGPMPDATMTTDASVDAPSIPMDASLADVSPDALEAAAPMLAIACGPFICTTDLDGPEGCCYLESASSSPYICAHKQDTCQGFGVRRYQCDDTEDCAALGYSAGTICCATLVPGATDSSTYQVDKSVCAQRTDCAVGNQLVRCNPTHNGQCKSGTSCKTVDKYTAFLDGGPPMALAYPIAACVPP